MRRRLQLAVALSCVAALLLVWGYGRIGWLTIVDARAATNMIRISSRSPGWIESVPVSETQRVDRGSVLLQLDPKPVHARLDEARAQLSAAQAKRRMLEIEYALVRANARTEIAARLAHEKSADTAVQIARLEAGVKAREWKRAESLMMSQLIADSVLDLRRAEYDQANGRTIAEQAKLTEASHLRAQAEASALRGDRIAVELEATSYEIQQAEARYAQLCIELDNASVRSPVKGIIDRVFARPGETVLAGQRLMLMHDPDDVWISANVKETDIRHVKIGAKALIRADAYADRKLIGTVTYIDRAATDQFALIPTPNPSGNFTKITQRVNVRIDLPDVRDRHRLSPGMMVVVKLWKR
jgi:membrane fusion protein, multidrug efflux system